MEWLSNASEGSGSDLVWFSLPAVTSPSFGGARRGTQQRLAVDASCGRPRGYKPGGSARRGKLDRGIERRPVACLSQFGAPHVGSRSGPFLPPDARGEESPPPLPPSRLRCTCTGWADQRSGALSPVSEP